MFIFITKILATKFIIIFDTRAAQVSLVSITTSTLQIITFFSIFSFLSIYTCIYIYPSTCSTTILLQLSGPGVGGVGVEVVQRGYTSGT
jgi:LytS/YehU family sensor histidine kinase